jgi:trimethylamine--corrinoid protein Co-methyltransferase
MPRKGISLQPRSRMWKPLTKNEVKETADVSFQILEEVGVYAEDENLLKVADENGCTVDYSKKVMYLPEHVVKGFIRKAPKSFVLAGRTEEEDVLLDPESGRAYGCFSSPMPKLCVWNESKRDYDQRDATEEDLTRTVRLYDGLEHVDVVIPPTLAMDAAKNGLAEHVHELCVTLSETTRHVNLANAAPKTPDEWDYYVRLAAEVVGGEEELRKRPIISGMSLFTPPLILSKSACSNLLGPTKYGLPLFLGGATSPLTILNACNIVVNHASALANLSLAQMLCPGVPCDINVGGFSLDVRHATTNYAAPENQLLNAILIQMVHDHMEIPVNYSPNQSSKTPDFQAVHDATIAMIFQWMTACDLWTNYSFNDYAFNAEMLVFQDELAAYLDHLGNRFIDSLPNERGVAFEVIKKIGPVGNYFTHKLTLENVALQYNPRLMDYRSYASWTKDRSDMMQRIRARIKELEGYTPRRLPRDATGRMREIVKEADGDSRSK